MWWVLSRYFAEKRLHRARTRDLYGRTSGAERALIALLLVAAILAGVAISAAAMAESEPVIATMYVLPDVSPYLNGRFEQSTKSTVEARFFPNDALEVVEFGTGWTRVLGGELGTVWVKSDYITATAPDSEPEAYTVTGNGRVNVRSAPDGERVRWAEVGEVVAVYGWAGEWAIVDGGFIDGSFLAEAQDD